MALKNYVIPTNGAKLLMRFSGHFSSEDRWFEKMHRIAQGGLGRFVNLHVESLRNEQRVRGSSIVVEDVSHWHFL